MIKKDKNAKIGFTKMALFKIQISTVNVKIFEIKLSYKIYHHFY